MNNFNEQAKLQPESLFRYNNFSQINIFFICKVLIQKGAEKRALYQSGSVVDFLVPIIL